MANLVPNEQIFHVLSLNRSLSLQSQSFPFTCTRHNVGCFKNMSKVEKDHDQTLSVASDDEGQILYNPSFETVLREDDDDSSVPPPPPPLYGISLAKISSSIFRSRNRERKLGTAADDEEIGGSPPVEILSAQDPAKSNVQVDAAEQWVKKFGMSQERNGKRRRSMMCTAILLILVIMMAVAIALSQGSDKARRNQSEQLVANNSTSAAEEATPSPAPQETMPPANTTEPPVATTLPAVNATEEPVESCTTTAIASQDTCYAPQSQITVSFTNCEAETSDWIGIWRVGDVANVTSLPEPLVWQWICGAQMCEVAVEQDSLTFATGLRAGTYVALLLHTEEDSAPYTGAFASSSSFEVARNCP